MRTIASVASSLNARYQQKSGQCLPMLLGMTDTRRCPAPYQQIARMPSGAALIYRNGDHPHREEIGLRLRDLCRENGVPFIWAGKAMDAIRLGADGLHLCDHPNEREVEAAVWKNHRPNHLLLAAAHSLEALRECANVSAKAALLSPVFPTATHPDAPHIGLSQFQVWASQSPLPVYALGGVTPETGEELLETQCVGIAGIDWLLNL